MRLIQSNSKREGTGPAGPALTLVHSSWLEPLDPQRARHLGPGSSRSRHRTPLFLTLVTPRSRRECPRVSLSALSRPLLVCVPPTPLLTLVSTSPDPERAPFGSTHSDRSWTTNPENL